MDETWLLDAAGQLVAGLPEAVDHALDEAAGVLDAAGRQRFRDGITARVADAGRALAHARPEPTPPAGAVWVESHRRGGENVPGHWRRRPGQG